jgi:BASS family bile acid:Na+ symporter
MNPVVDVVLPLALAFIMFSLGLGLVPADFRRVFAQARAVLLGLFCQVALLPMLAWATAVLFALPPAMALGLVIIGACPGGITSGLLTHLARGDTALSVTITAVSSVATAVTLPFVVAAALAFFAGQQERIELPLVGMVRGLVLMTTLPVALGMLVRRLRPVPALRLLPAVQRVANLFFGLIVVATFVSQWGVLRDHAVTVGPAVAVLNLAGMAAAFALASAGGADRRGRIAIAMECGLQNGALGIFVAGTLLGDPALAIPSVVYALLMNVSALALVAWGRRRTSGAAPGPA